ncbi:hypothetical protein [Rhizobium leguminosarum]|uniref:hypothetical protein n=1 Tax=Rhizobium leguminosarum TaxID=384 RepID=UPI001C8FA95E|nr:hypothetical protein [Rhizobium leguminosarum]MBY2951398.1 hypothetical protein [Rhizobium leguminosarum]
MNRRDKMHPDKARCDSPEMRLAFLDGERVVAPRRAIRRQAGRYVNRSVVTCMEPSLEKLPTLQQPSAEFEASISLGLTKALLATKHEPEGMGQITWSLSKSERVFDCAGGDSDNGETIATDGQTKDLANRGYITPAVGDEADTRPPKGYHEHVDFENCHYIDAICTSWRHGFLKAGRLSEIPQAVDIGSARAIPTQPCAYRIQTCGRMR